MPTSSSKDAVAINDAGAYVPVTMRLAAAPANPQRTNDDIDGGMSLYQSFYETALKQDCRVRSSTKWCAPSPTTSISSARRSPAI